MAESNTEIANMALGFLGVGKELQSLDDDDSATAAACRRFYETALRATLRDFPWPFATKITDLTLVEEDPNDEWAYSYRMPSDCVMLRRILSGDRNDSRQSRIESKIAQDDDGILIFTDLDEAQAEYTSYEDQEHLYPPDFSIAFAWRLAAYIAPKVTGGDPFKNMERALQMYGFEISRARANAANEQQDPEPVESEFIRARD